MLPNWIFCVQVPHIWAWSRGMRGACDRDSSGLRRTLCSALGGTETADKGEVCSFIHILGAALWLKHVYVFLCVCVCMCVCMQELCMYQVCVYVL